MDLSCTSSQRRPFQGECRQRSHLSMIQRKVRFFRPLLLPPFISTPSKFLQLLPLQRGTRKQLPRISRSIPRSPQISTTPNQTPSTPTWFTTSGLVASLIRRADRQRGTLRSTPPPPITGQTSSLMMSSLRPVHSLRGISSSPMTHTSPGSPTPPRNRICCTTIPSREDHKGAPSI